MLDIKTCTVAMNDLEVSGLLKISLDHSDNRLVQGRKEHLGVI
jgi:hypothetical protein